MSTSQLIFGSAAVWGCAFVLFSTASLRATAEPEFDEFLVLRFKATNAPPIRLVGELQRDPDGLRRSLSRISARYQQRFARSISSFRRCSGASSLEHVEHRVVPFVTSVFVDRPRGLGQGRLGLQGFVNAVSTLNS
jgi:hypothetical protein